MPAAHDDECGILPEAAPAYSRPGFDNMTIINKCRLPLDRKIFLTASNYFLLTASSSSFFRKSIFAAIFASSPLGVGWYQRGSAMPSGR